jgi:hypothetical protein
MVKSIGNYNIIPQLAPPISGMHNVHTFKNKISKPISDYIFRSYSYTLQKGQKVRLPIPSSDHEELCHFNQVSFQSGVVSCFTISSVPKDFGIDIANGIFKTMLTLF